MKLLHLEKSSLGSVKRFPATNCGGAAVVPDADSYIYQSSREENGICMCRVQSVLRQLL